jgi:hypothetical protein
MFGKLALRALCVLAAGGLCSCGSPAGVGKPAGAAPAPKPAAGPATWPAGLADGQWRDLFDGKTLKGWRISAFAGAGRAYVKDGLIHVDRGESCSGINWVDGNDLPREDYEVFAEAQRVADNDFFCALTFPVGKDYITFVPGGWSGSITGLSCINGYDASDNMTTKTIDFKNGEWYQFRARVTKGHIVVYIDDKETIKVPRKDKKISVRMEVEPSQPLGIATWQTHGAVKAVRIRKLSPAEIRAAAQEAAQDAAME